MKHDFTKYKFKLVNGEVHPFSEYDEADLDRDGFPVHVDDYGMGAVDWPLMENESDAEETIHIQNVNWAKNRLPWAKKNAPKEVDYLLEVIGGRKQNFKLVREDS